MKTVCCGNALVGWQLYQNCIPIETITTYFYSRDVFDHITQAIEITDTELELLNAANVYYGMNFDNMPELKNPNGYFIPLGAYLSSPLACCFILGGRVGYRRGAGAKAGKLPRVLRFFHPKIPNLKHLQRFVISFNVSEFGIFNGK